MGTTIWWLFIIQSQPEIEKIILNYLNLKKKKNYLLRLINFDSIEKVAPNRDIK
jgi:hypothetical protein